MPPYTIITHIQHVQLLTELLNLPRIQKVAIHMAFDATLMLRGVHQQRQSTQQWPS